LVDSTLDLKSWVAPTIWPVGSDVPSGLRSMPPYTVGCAESVSPFLFVPPRLRNFRWQSLPCGDILAIEVGHPTRRYPLAFRWMCTSLTLRQSCTLFVMVKEVTMRETFRAFLIGILILATALIPPVISAMEQLGGV